MLFDIFTLFPEAFQPYLELSILKRGIEKGFLKFAVHDIRSFTTDRHHTTDEPPYGGGGGMVMKPEPVFAAIESVIGNQPDCPIILLSPQGRLFNHCIAQELSTYHHLALLCGHYEGVDERIRQYLVTDEISIGDYVLTGGELPALVIIDSICRFLPGILGDPDGAMDDSYTSGLLEYPHYTRPPVFRDHKVPEELLSGNHALIARWRREHALMRTLERRPDLLKTANLSDTDLKFLDQLKSKYKNDS